MKHVKAYDSGAFNAVTVLCNHDLYQVPKHFHPPQTKFCTPWAVTPRAPSLSPWKPLVCFLCVWIYLFWMFCRNGIVTYVTFCVWPLSLSMFWGGILLWFCVFLLLFLAAACSGLMWDLNSQTRDWTWATVGKVPSKSQLLDHQGTPLA